jgi:hypothetical protein
MLPTRRQELAVLQSVTYAALFDYPLTLAQLRESLIGVEADEAAIASWCATSGLLRATVDERAGVYFPAGRRDLLATRVRREAVSRRLLQHDRRLVALVAGMPFVRMVALSGSLAHLNAESGADVDLFVITAPGRVWFVTVVVLVAARVMGWRQRLCLNYVTSERALAVAPADLFSANQIIHLRPLLGEPAYRAFLAANTFVRRWYPNFRPRPNDATRPSGWMPRRARTAVEVVLSATGLAALGDRLGRAAYGWHLRRRATAWRSRDQVRLEPECLKLHTSSHRAATLERFDAAMAEALATESVEREVKLG